MNPIDKAAHSMALFIRNNNPNAASEIALKYTLSLMINTLSAIILSLIICSFTGHMTQGLVVSFVLLALRYVSGGFHMKSSLSCCIFSIFLIVTLSHLNYNYIYLGVILDIISIIILAIKAPNGLENVSRIDPKYYIVLKIIAILIVSSNFLLQNSLLSSVFITQSLMLFKATSNIFDYIEGRFLNEKANGHLS